MKKMNFITLGLTFTGSFLGAGYISGQEIWQFFGCFGVYGVFGLLLAIAIQCVFGNIILKLSRDTGVEELDLVVIRPEMPKLRLLLGVTEVFFLFGICVIMYAGAGALFEQVMAVPPIIGAGIICLLVTIVSFYSFNALVSALSLLVPLLVLASLVLSAVALYLHGFSGFLPMETHAQNAFGGWVFSAMTFVSYNLFCAIAILTPLSRRVKSRKTIGAGVLLGCVLLFVIAFSIILALTAMPDSLEAELPMLALAQTLSPTAGYIFAILLLGCMFSAALCCMVATLEFLGQKSEFLHKRKVLITIVLGILAWIMSLFGFGNLISIVYPLCGYCGYAALVGVLEHYFYARRLHANEQ